MNCDIVTYGFTFLSTRKFGAKKVYLDNKQLIKTWYTVNNIKEDCITSVMTCPDTPFSNCNNNFIISECIMNIQGFTIDKTNPVWVFHLVSIFNGVSPYTYYWSSSSLLFTNPTGNSVSYSPVLIVSNSHPLTTITLQVIDHNGCIANFHQSVQF